MANTIREVLLQYKAELSNGFNQASTGKTATDLALAETKRIIENAKPVIENDDAGAKWAADDYHTNLMKALGESIDKQKQQHYNAP